MDHQLPPTVHPVLEYALDVLFGLEEWRSNRVDEIGITRLQLESLFNVSIGQFCGFISASL